MREKNQIYSMSYKKDGKKSKKMPQNAVSPDFGATGASGKRFTAVFYGAVEKIT